MHDALFAIRRDCPANFAVSFWWIWLEEKRSRPSPDAFGLVVVPDVGAPYRSPVAVSADGSVVRFFDRASDTAHSDFMGQDRTDLAESMLRTDLSLGANNRTRIVAFRHTPRTMSADAATGWVARNLGDFERLASARCDSSCR